MESDLVKRLQMCIDTLLIYASNNRHGPKAAQDCLVNIAIVKDKSADALSRREAAVVVPRELLEAFATDEGAEQHSLDMLRAILAASERPK